MIDDSGSPVIDDSECFTVHTSDGPRYFATAAAALAAEAAAEAQDPVAAFYEAQEAQAEAQAGTPPLHIC